MTSVCPETGQAHLSKVAVPLPGPLEWAAGMSGRPAASRSSAMRSVQGSRVCARLRWLAAAFLLLACVSPAHAQVPAGYSEYYIPGDEDNLSLALCTHGGAACTSTATHSVISVTGWADTTAVYYDHWENGYNFDPANPTTADETYNLNTGQRLIFESATITLPRTATPPTGSTCTKLRNGAAATTTPNLALRLLRRPRPHLHGRRPRHRRARGVEPGERRGRPGRGVGDLPGQAAAHGLHLPLRREHPVGRDRHLVRLPAGGRARPGHRGQHDHHDRRERRRSPRPHQRQPQRDQERGRRGHHHGHAEQGPELPPGPGQRVPPHHQTARPTRAP